MGHIRLGRLPKTRKWPEVIALLGGDSGTSSKVAMAVARAAEEALVKCGEDPGLVYSYWLLSQITWFARGGAFSTSLLSLGLDIRNIDSPLIFVSRVNDFAIREILKRGHPTVFTEIAQLGMKQALLELIGERSKSLFGTTQEDIRLACAGFATRKQFGALARLYFSNFLERSLKFFVDKEISNHIGPNRRFSSPDDSRRFLEALGTFSYQSSRIIEEFAGSWYSKRNWQGNINEDDARRFVHVALDKLRKQLNPEGTT